MKIPVVDQIRRNWSKLAWVACLLLVIGLAAGGWSSAWAALRQAHGMRGLLQAGAALSPQDLSNPFVCLRGTGDLRLAQASAPYLIDPYLQGVGLCLAGDTQAGLAALEAADSDRLARLQVAGGTAAMDAQSRVDAFIELGLPDEELAALLRSLSALPGVEPYPALRLLAQKANAENDTWWRWIRAEEHLAGEGSWQAALEWMGDGLGLAPSNVQSSLYQRLGRIYQSYSDPREFQAALENYNRALELDAWLYPGDAANTHLFRGEVYRVLKDQFGPQQALAEFEAALKVLPGNYWGLLAIGHVYLYDLKALDRAEEYYRQALASDASLPYAYYYLGEVDKARGDNPAAAEWYALALEHQADFQPAIDRLSQLSSP